ncbi:hypothetical protein ACP70R_003311 [Stipagrostis hirtigluma subsp. patula]
MASNAFSSRNRKLTSEVWKYFHYKPSSTPGGEDKAICRTCGETLCAGGNNGTTHLWRHVDSKKCRDQAASKERQLPPPAGTESSLGGQVIVCGINVPQPNNGLRANEPVRGKAVGAAHAQFPRNTPLAASSSSQLNALDDSDVDDFINTLIADDYE